MKTLSFSDTEPFFNSLREFCTSVINVADVADTVTSVLEDVEKRGDAAVLEYTERFDRASLNASKLRVTAKALKAAESVLTADQRSAVEQSIAQVSNFHEKTLPKAWSDTNAQGGVIGERFYPIHRVGLYIPGGNVPLVSTVVMTAVLAKLVKCPEVCVCTPPRADGSVAPEILAVLSIIGIDEIYTIGGAQAIGAMAYGTAKIPAVDKIFGPGNAFVMEAKRQVLGLSLIHI